MIYIQRAHFKLKISLGGKHYEEGYMNGNVCVIVTLHAPLRG